MMRRFVMTAALASLAFAPSAMAIEMINITDPYHARSLSGVVVDQNGTPIAGVVVKGCDPKFVIALHGWDSEGKPLPDEMETDCEREPSHVLRSTTTDATGHFSFPRQKFPNQKRGATHSLYFYRGGFDSTKIKVKTRLFAKAEIRIILDVAT